MAKKVFNKIAAIAAVTGVVCLGLGVGAGFVLDTPQTITKVVTLPGEEVIVNQTVVETVIETVEVPVIQEVIVEVDNQNLDLVLDEIYEADGSVEYLIEDLDDDEMSQVVDRIVFIQDAKALAMNELDSELKDELDMIVFNASVTFDEDEIYRVSSDSEDFVVSDVDFDRNEVELTLPITFKQDGVRYSADVTFQIEDNEVDDMDITNIQLV